MRIRDTSFQLQTTLGTPAPSIQDVLKELVDDEARNDLIFDDVLCALEEGRSPVVITERTAHLETIAKRLEHFARHVVVLRGGQGEATGSVNKCATDLFRSYNPKVMDQCVAVCKKCDYGITTTCTTSCTLKGAQ